MIDASLKSSLEKSAINWNFFTILLRIFGQKNSCFHYVQNIENIESY